MKYYIKPTGSTCYDNKGITYPIQKRFLHHTSRYLTTIVCNFVPCGKATMEPIYGYSNCVNVVTFNLNNDNGQYDRNIEKLETWLNDHYKGFIVKECEDW